MTNEMPSEINADLQNIGEILKNKREELSYTLEHVSEITRINLSTLKNIEEGNLESQSGLVFVRGFIRNYAKLLGLESDWMIEALNKEYSEKTRHSSTSASTSTPKTSNELSGVNKYFMLVCSIIILLIGGLIYWNFHHNAQIASNVETIESIQAEPQQPSIEVPSESDELSQNEIKKETSAEPKQIEEPAPVPVISPLNLVLIGNESEWIRLSVDNQDAKEILLKKGERYEWPAEEVYSLTMTTGKTATIYLNGEEIEVSKEKSDLLFSIKLNKFSLTKMNN